MGENSEIEWTSPVPATRCLTVAVNDDVIARALRQYLGMPNGRFASEEVSFEFDFCEIEQTEIIPQIGGDA